MKGMLKLKKNRISITALLGVFFIIFSLHDYYGVLKIKGEFGLIDFTLFLIGLNLLIATKKINQTTPTPLLLLTSTLLPFTLPLNTSKFPYELTITCFWLATTPGMHSLILKRKEIWGTCKKIVNSMYRKGGGAHPPKIGLALEITLLCVLSFVAVYFHFYNLEGYMSLFEPDEGYYATAAKLVYEGMVPYKDFVFTHTPLYLYLLSKAYLIFGVSIITARMVTATIAIFTVLVLYAFVRRLYNPLIAVLAFIFYALNPVVLISDRIVQLSTPVLFFVLLAVYYLILSKKNVHLFTVGTILGIGFLLKEATLLALAGIILFLLWEKKKTKVKYVIGGFGVGASPLAYLFYEYPTQIKDYLLYHITRPATTLGERFEVLSYLFADPFVFILGIFGFFIAFRRKNASDKLVISLFVTSFLSLLNTGFWFHYIPQQVLMLAALAGVGAFHLYVHTRGLARIKPMAILIFFIAISLVFTLPTDYKMIRQVSDILPRIATRVAEISSGEDYILTSYPAIAFVANRKLVGALYEIGPHYLRFTDNEKMIRISKEKAIKVIIVSDYFAESDELKEFLNFVYMNYSLDSSFYMPDAEERISVYVLPTNGPAQNMR